MSVKGLMTNLLPVDFKNFWCSNRGNYWWIIQIFELTSDEIHFVDKDFGDKGLKCHQKSFLHLLRIYYIDKKVFIGSSLFHTRVALQRIKSQCLVFCKILLVLKHLIQIDQHLYHHKNNPKSEAMMGVDSSAEQWTRFLNTVSRWLDSFDLWIKHFY